MPSVYHGSCLCKSVKYQITGEPFTFFVCHCNNCKKSSGSAFMANAFFKLDQVVVLKGEETIRHYHDADTDSGAVLIRSFCPKCGSNLFLGNGHENYKIVTTGSVDGINDWVPRRENYPGCKRPWITGITFNPKSRSKL